MVIWVIVACLSALWVGGAWGQIYRWADHQGNVYFTDNPSRIPPEYRSKVTVERASPPASPQAPDNNAPQTRPTDDLSALEPPATATPRDRLGRGPDYWQQLAQQWSTRLQQHNHERERLQLLYNYSRHLASTTRDVFDRGRVHADMSRLEKALAEVEAGIKEAETMLRTTLPLEARRLGADPDWLKSPGTMQQ